MPSLASCERVEDLSAEHILVDVVVAGVVLGYLYTYNPASKYTFK